MSKLSKQALKVDNNTSFPNNNTGYITPAILRAFNDNIIDSMVDELPYGEYTQSVDVSIEALNAFTASAQSLTTGSLLITASAASNVITFTKGDGSQFNVTVADTTDLSSLNAFTASATISITALNANTASQQISIDALNVNSASVNSSIAQINAYTASNSTASIQSSITQLNAFSASALVSISNLNTTTASLNSSVTQLNASSASQQVSINALNTYTASASTASIVSSITQLNQATASLQSFSSSALVSISNLNTATASLNTSVTNLNSFSASQLSKDATLATYTGSNDTKWSNLGAQSGSWITESETGSFAYINKDNNWSANQTFTNITAVSASFTYVQTLYETSSVIYSSGSNQFGDAIDDTQTLYGLVRISGSQQVTGSVGFTGGDVNFTDQGRNINIDVDRTIIKGQKAVLISQSLDVQSGFTASLAAGYAWVGNGVGRAEAVATSSFVVSINTGSLATTGSNTFIGNQTITGSLSTNGGATFGNTSAQYNSVNIVTSKTNFPANVYNAFNINTDGDGQWSAGLYVSTYNGFGSEPAFGLYGGGLGNGGSNNVLESYGNLVRVNKNTQISGSLEVSASLKVNGSNVIVSSQTGSFATTGSNAFFGTNSFSGAVAFTGSAPTILSSSFSGSLITNLTDIYTDVPAVNKIVTLTSASYASLVTGGTVDPNTLYVVSGSSSTALPNGIVSSSAQILNYNIFATTGSNFFNGTQTISGSLSVSGSGGVTITKNGGNGLTINNSGLDSAGTIVGRNNIQTLGQYATNYIMANSNFSGSQYPGQTIIVAPNVYPTDIYGGLSIVTELGNAAGATFLGVVANSYSPQYNGTTVPMIIANGNNPAGNDTALIWTSDGSAEHYKKSRFKYSVDVTGSLVTSGSFELTGSAYGNVVSASITSNTASIDFSKGNYFEVTSSVTPLHLNVTNIKPGTTSTLIISASASSSILFSPNVAQPSGSAYSGSAGSIDILSLVSFNTSKVNVVSTKALV